MHLDATVQRGAKATIAGDALRRIARIAMDDPPIVAAPTQFGYRSKVTLTVRGDRIGYRRYNDPDDVFDVRECPIAEPAVQQLIAGLRTGRRHLPRDATRVVLRRDRNDGLHIIVRTGEAAPWTGGRALHMHFHSMQLEVTVWWHPEGGAPRAVAGSDDPWPATVFEQVNPAVGRLVREHAVDALGDVSGVHVWDLYSGIGETTAMLAGRGASVESVERDTRAVAAATRVGPVGPLRHSGTAEETTVRLRAPGAIVANPPRTGLPAEVLTAVATSGADRVVYISCDPATLSRDIGRMADTYELRRPTLFDQFPQTAHLETVAVLERR